MLPEKEKGNKDKRMGGRVGGDEREQETVYIQVRQKSKKIQLWFVLFLSA